MSFALHLKADSSRTSLVVRFVPSTDAIGALDTVNSLYEEPFVSSPQGGGSPPPAAIGSPSPTRALSKQHLHAVLWLVRRTARPSSFPLASRPSSNRFGPNRCGPRRSGMACCPPREHLSHSCHLKLCVCGKLFQILILLPFLHSPRWFSSRGYPTSLSCGHDANCGWSSWTTRFDLVKSSALAGRRGSKRRPKNSL
jgi:hypothetical protein